MNCKKNKDLVFHYLEGRLTMGEKNEFERHLHGCPACSSRLHEIKRLDGLLQTAVTPLPGVDGDGAWRRIAAALEAVPPRRQAFFPAPRRLALAAGFLAFFILGVAMARLFFFPARTDPGAPATAPFLYSAQDYFSALQPVLAEFANARAGETGDSAHIRPLLNNLRLLRLRAEKDRDSSLAALLDDVELILLEIAHLDRSDPEDARLVNALIQEKGIAMKMKVFKFNDRKTTRM